VPARNSEGGNVANEEEYGDEVLHGKEVIDGISVGLSVGRVAAGQATGGVTGGATGGVTGSAICAKKMEMEKVERGEEGGKKSKF